MQQNPLGNLSRAVFEREPIIEFAGLLLKFRYAVLVGAVVGLLSGFAFVHLRKPVFTTVVSVAINPASLPAAESSESVLAKYNVALRYANAAAAATAVLSQALPNTEIKLPSGPQTQGVLLKAQTAVENAGGFGRLPLFVTRGASSPAGVGEISYDYLIVAQLPRTGLNPQTAAQTLTNAVNAAALVFNERERQAHAARTQLQPEPLNPVLAYVPRFQPNSVPLVQFEETRGKIFAILGSTFFGAVLSFYACSLLALLRASRGRLTRIVNNGFKGVFR